MVSDDDNELAAVNYLNTQEGNEAMSFCLDVAMRLLRETGEQNGIVNWTAASAGRVLKI